ncbi:type IV pilin N-terminal domain-containing protein [Halopiger xanaduensis]|uniref:Flagellin domain protein n=1 Tax=Halopiger xanaduensis (strain DSM 18323 / JCM 14033 / SH-6) TaxID=797210 RepID=F8D7L1_HALXS|nr:type IV pilin N-terminal domain-containing protein [Halopiger xanaduensis]AEH36452.1 flagellin domain protein [Halopiger xanaduensis SH-6]
MIRRASVCKTPSDRSVSSVVGTILLLVIAVSVAGVILIGVSTWTPESPAMTAFELSADSDRSTITIEHRVGDTIDVRELSITVIVDGTELTEQPPVPFVGATGFDGAPTGPFNAKADPKWSAGERASFAVASTNEPSFKMGDLVRVRLVVDGQVIADLEAVAR